MIIDSYVIANENSVIKDAIELSSRSKVACIILFIIVFKLKFGLTYDICIC